MLIYSLDPTPTMTRHKILILTLKYYVTVKQATDVEVLWYEYNFIIHIFSDKLHHKRKLSVVCIQTFVLSVVQN